MQKLEDYWQEVVDRNPQADGQFVFAVKSTGIYCRPSCRSRRPLRKNVEFFKEPASARQSGYRACKRCLPDNPSGETSETTLILGITEYLKQAASVPTLQELSDKFNISRFHLQRLFKKNVGVSPRQYAADLRSGRLKEELRRGSSVTQAIYEAGYNTSSVVYQQKTAELGMTPSQYKTGGQGVTISYSTTACSLGLLLVAVTQNGVCAVILDDSKSKALERLRDEFPLAQIEQGTEEFLQNARRLIEAYINGDATEIDLPLDLKGTPFQLKVWKALRSIPYGKTASYAEIASTLGNPAAARAVARACATNPAALVVPCHRVVRQDGQPSGYRWGLHRKERLLQNEKK